MMPDSPLIRLTPEEIVALIARYDALEANVRALEDKLRSYLAKERETAIITFSHIEDELGMPRTKEKRNRTGG